MILIAKTYWGGAPFHFRKPPADATVESRVLTAEDFRQLRAHYWTPRATPRPKVAVLCMHPRVDFSHHYSFPRLLEAGIGCLGASTRHPNNDTDLVHEEALLDVAACVRWLKERRGVEKVILVGNSGGGSLFAYYQAQAEKPGPGRVAETPGGDRTKLPGATLVPADGLVLLSAHRGEGHVLAQCIDPSVTDEADPFSCDASLDMYARANGFRPAPEWSEYEPSFVARFRAGQAARVARLDAIARAHLARAREAAARAGAEDFRDLPFEEQQRVQRQQCFEPVMVVYRTMANLHYVDRHLDPSEREYGSLLSDRPDLMNWKALGFGRTVTPRAWLSTWSGNASLADVVRNLGQVAAPTLVVNAGRDREIYPEADARPIFAAVAAEDRTFLEYPRARHYFEPDFGQKDAPDVAALMDDLVPWISTRFC